jgi:signal transduction histidine kinase
MRGAQRGCMLPCRIYYTMSSLSDPPPTGPVFDSVGALDWPNHLRVLLGAALELSGPHDQDTLLQRIVEGAASVAGARYAALGMYGDDGQLTAFVHHGFDEATITAVGRLPQGRGLLGQVIISDLPVRLNDLGSHESSVGFPAGHPAMRTFLGVPILRAGRRYGNLYLTEKARGVPFDETDEALIVALAAFAAGVMATTEFASLERSRAAAEQQARARRDLLGHVIAAQEDERTRVSRDLHDDVGQALTSVLLGLRLVEDSLARPDIDTENACRRIADLRELVVDALRRTRQLAFDLRPTVLDDIGLVPALQRLVEDLTARTSQVVELDVAGLHPDERLPSEIETVIYRVVQEALTNIVRHAAASTASVTLNVRDGQIRVFIEDDGVGFDPARRHERPHLGLDGMHERAELVQGSLSISSTPGNGTVVLLELSCG